MIREKYDELCTANNWEPDPAQLEAIDLLDSVRENVITSQSLVTKLTNSFKSQKHKMGCYLFGSVGRGKTMMMDLFFDSLPIKEKSRLHFHNFMQNIHDELHHIARQEIDEQPISIIIDTLAKENKIICLDDLEVTEIGDAMILRRLFEGLLQAGVFVVMTSNRIPTELYKGGLHYDRFKPFVDLVCDKLVVKSFDTKICTDYRRLLSPKDPVYFIPNDMSSLEHCKSLFNKMTRGKKGEPKVIEHHGRDIFIPQVVAHEGATFAWSDFSHICEAAMGPSDYRKIGEEFSTLFLMSIPYFTDRNKDATRRFITLIDELYDRHVVLVCSAVDIPDQLYRSRGLPFARTASRLIEMQSESYLRGD